MHELKLDSRVSERAKDAFIRATEEFARQYPKWKTTDSQSIETWNPSIKQAGENFCHAADFMHFSVLTDVQDMDVKEQCTQKIVELLDEFYDKINTILEKGVKGESVSRYRTNILVSLLITANTTRAKVDNRMQQTRIQTQKKEAAIKPKRVVLGHPLKP